MNEFLILLQAKLDEAKSKENVNTDIGKLQYQLDELKVQVKLDPNAAQKLADDIGKLINQKIVISNIGLNQSNLSKAGQQIGQVISDSAEKAIGNVTSKNIGRYFRVNKSDSRQFQSEMEKLVSEWTNGKGKVTDINIQTRTSYDKKAKENIERLHQATVTYKNELDEVIKKTIAWRQIGTTINAKGEKEVIRGFVEVAGQYSKAIDSINTKTDTFNEKQKNAVASAQNKLSTIESKLHDKGANKTLANTDFDINGLNNQINAVKNAIDILGNSSRETFGQAQRDVDREINSLNNLITSLKNAEYAATSLRTKDIETVKIDESNKLDAFIQKMEQSGHYTDELKNKVIHLKLDLSNVFDVNSLTNYLNSVSNLQTEFQKVDATAKTVEKSAKLQTNISAEKKILQVYVNELKEAGVLSGDVKTKIQEMFHSLSKVESQNGLTTWRAELKGVKAETDAVLKSVTQLSQKKIDEIQLLMDNGKGASEYQNRINAITASLEKYGIETQEAQKITASLQSIFDSMKGMSGQELVTQADKLEQEFKAVKISVDQAKLSYDKFAQPASDEKISTLIIRIQRFLEKNTNITKEAQLQLSNYIQELSGGKISLARWNQINSELKKTERTMGALGRLGKSFSEQIKEIGKNVTSYLSISSVFMSLISKTRESITELKDLDSILTEISKTSNLTEQQLKNLGSSSFDSASKYGKVASDYLVGVQEMFRAGYRNAEKMSELSILAQAAGDLDANTANDYLIATDAAYNLKGNIEELNKVLDGQNFITNNAAVSMLDMAQATSEAASIASQYGIKIDELSSLIAVATSKTRESGSETGTALKALFVNLQDTTSKPIKEAFDAVNISMTEMVNGAEKLKSPIQLLKELSDAFVSLDEGDARRANILSDIGGKHHANTLSAILSDWSSYEKMIGLYSHGIGSAAQEAEKSSKNWEGSMNRLSNTWTSTVNNIANSDAIITSINSINGVISVVDKLTNALGSLGTIGLGAGLLAGFKNAGRVKCCPSYRICLL
jgi:TP901 family phage tail tape measure protein